jgi:hypothetical protein
VWREGPTTQRAGQLHSGQHETSFRMSGSCPFAARRWNACLGHNAASTVVVKADRWRLLCVTRARQQRQWLCEISSATLCTSSHAASVWNNAAAGISVRFFPASGSKPSTGHAPWRGCRMRPREEANCALQRTPERDCCTTSESGIRFDVSGKGQQVDHSPRRRESKLKQASPLRSFGLVACAINSARTVQAAWGSAEVVVVGGQCHVKPTWGSSMESVQLRAALSYWVPVVARCLR